MEPILQVRDLWITFKRLGGGIGPRNVNAVKDVSFDLGESEIFSVVGESGSGKTTLGKGIARLVPPTKGSILYKGNNVMKLRGEELRKYRADVQMVFQDPFGSLNPRYDVLTTVSEPLQNLSHLNDPTELKEIVGNLLEEVGLDSERVLTRYPHQLSGGERQRVNIARAIASEPKILIADEPITMLDAEQRLSVLSLLMDLKSKRRLSVLFITHDLASAKLVSDRIMVMYLGKIVESGDTEAVLTKPHHPYAEVILKAMPTLHTYADAVQRELKIAMRDDFVGKGCAFRPKCAYANEKCAEIEPSLVEITRSHYAACHWPLNST